MTRVFDRNMFIMMLSIMIGIIMITYFVSATIANSKIETLNVEIENINRDNENFTSHFLSSSVILDSAREGRVFGNYHFDLAFLWYKSALSQKNITLMEQYKERSIDNCTNALPYYKNSNLNFELASEKFYETKNYTDYKKYTDILDIYIDLSNSGSDLANLRYAATIYLKCLVENITMDLENGTVMYLGNVSGLLDLFNFTMGLYEQELIIYEEYQDQIDEYEFFDEIR